MKRLIETSVVAAMVVSLTSPVFAQDVEADNVGVAELQARIEALEEAAADSSSDLTIGVGKATTVTLYGFVRFETFYDFDFEQGDLTRSARIGEAEFETNGEFETSVRVSRFGILSATPTEIGEIKTQLEFDLFSGTDETSSPNPRLRHANINIDDTYLFGQFWTNFMPIVHYPRTADFNGPVGVTFARVPQARYTYKTGGFEISGSIEEANGSGSSDPVGTLAMLYRGGNFSARIAGLVGTFEVDGEDINTNGITLSGAFTPIEGSTITGTFATGQGLGNLLIGGGVQGVDGEANDSNSFTLQLIQDVNEKLSLGVAYGFADYDDLTNTGTIDFDQLQSVFLNAFYSPVDKLTFAGEYSLGTRDGSSGSDDANRIGASVTYSF